MSEQHFDIIKTILDSQRDWTITSYQRSDGRELHEHPFPLDLSVSFDAHLLSHIIVATFHNGTGEGGSFHADFLMRDHSFNAYEAQWIEEEGELTISNDLEAYTFYTEARWIPGV